MLYFLGFQYPDYIGLFPFCKLIETLDSINNRYGARFGLIIALIILHIRQDGVILILFFDCGGSLFQVQFFSYGHHKYVVISAFCYSYEQIIGADIVKAD